MARTSERGGASKIISRGGIRKANPLQFLQETITELKKSVWPTREETVRLTYIVILLSTAIGLLLALLDFGFGRTFGEFIVR